jgi:hypothetical protein
MVYLKHVQPMLLQELVFEIYQYLMIKIFVQMDMKMFLLVKHEAMKVKIHLYRINVYSIIKNLDLVYQLFHQYLLHVLDNVQHMIHKVNL